MREKIITRLLSCALALTAVSSSVSAQFIKTIPSGQLKTYERGGYAYYNNNGNLRRGAQTGTIDIVYGSDGVYMKDPISKAVVKTWVKGFMSKDSTTITLPLGQAIYYDATQQDSVIIGVMDLDEDYEEFTEDTSVKDVTYTVKGNVITLNGTGRDKVLAAMWKKSRQWAEYADYNTKYTLQEAEDTLVVPPAGLTTETYGFSGNSYVYSRAKHYNVSVGFAGNDMYIKGLFSDTPNAWIKGTKKGNTYVFPHGQMLGPTHSGTTNYYMIATDHANTSQIEDLVLEANSDGSFSTDQFVVLNTAKNSVYLVDAFDSVKIKKVMLSSAYPVPYTQGFDAGLQDFTVIDGNKDGITWAYNSISETVTYNWSKNNNGDEWLITPAIILQAGHKYKFSVKARSFTASEPEKMEVKIGNAPAAEAMTSQIMDTTTVATGEMTEFSKTFSVSADGNYYIGIHAVSDKDNMALTIDDLSITDAETTGIESITRTSDSAGAPVYNLSGMRVDGTYHGIVVKNGRKYLQK